MKAPEITRDLFNDNIRVVYEQNDVKLVFVFCHKDFNLISAMIGTPRKNPKHLGERKGLVLTSEELVRNTIPENLKRYIDNGLLLAKDFLLKVEGEKFDNFNNWIEKMEINDDNG